MEAIKLRVQDIDFDINEVIFRADKGNKDRITVLPQSIKPDLVEHLAKRQTLFEADSKIGQASVYLPNALARKYPNADKEWRWQFVLLLPGWVKTQDQVLFGAIIVMEKPSSAR